MPHPYSFNQVQIIGDAYNGQEIWTTGFSIGATEQGSADPTIEAAEAIANAWVNWFTATNSGTATSHRTLAVKYNKMGTDGKQVTDPTIEYVLPTPAVGASATGNHPAQCTMVLSLRAEQSRGLATKGRMYLPTTAFQVGQSGKVSESNITLSLDMLQTFFQAIRNTAPVLGVPILTSGSGILGATNAVSTIAMGTVYDTQRRRRNDLTEEYVERDIGLTP